MSNDYLFTRIGYVYMPTSDIEKSIEWYTYHLDFKLMQKFADRGSLLAAAPSSHAFHSLIAYRDGRQPSFGNPS